MTVAPLSDLRVVQQGGGLDVAYCTKVLGDAGADVIVIEPEEGHPLRRRSVTGADLNGGSSPIFDYLHAGKGSVVAPDHDPLLARADVLVTGDLDLSWADLHARHGHLTVVAITPFGLEGPWARRPATDLTLQAASGGMAPRGGAGRAPLMVGGEPSYWFGGAVAACALLGVLGRRDGAGEGELLDVSLLETTNLEHCMHPITFHSMSGRPFTVGRGVPVPGVEPTADGWVGFFVITGQQWLDFCSLIGRPDWHEDESLFIAAERRQRADDLQRPIREWTRTRSTEEIVEVASLMRIPVAPIGTGETIISIDHFVAEEWFVENPSGFVQPRRPYRFRGESISPPAPAPVAGETGPDDVWPARPPRRPAARSAGSSPLPLAGLRVADFTGFWAGPLAGGILAGFGADVVHVEGPTKPDGIRMNTIRAMDESGWWEWSPLFCGANTNKRGLCVDLATEAGLEVALDLLATCDVMLENLSPRVVEQLGLGPGAALAANPRMVVVRMPAFGVSGPWRDRVGFAQTIEQAVGMASLTGYAGEAPTIPNGMCDPIAGVHGAIAALVGISERDRTGVGQVVEAPMIGGGLNTTAEQVLDHSAFGRLLTSAGNRSPLMFQDVYRCAGEDEWVAVSVPDDAADAALKSVLDDVSGGDPIRDRLAAWCGDRDVNEVVVVLSAAGVAAERVAWGHQIGDNPQLQARGYWEMLDHPVCGEHPYASFPVRFSAGPEIWNRAPAPTMGEHNTGILTEIGYGDDAIADLRASGVLAEGVVSRQHGW
jgi:crotonobetainyl-CoA:carnitine CoA-transferase CaiB-like acyl-CoA transferase